MIDKAVLVDDQPISGATLFHESCWLTDWVRPNSLEIQVEYQRLTQGLASDWDKVLACFGRVLDIPYTPSVKIRVSVDGKSFTQDDAWLEPGQALMAPSLNCANRSFLLASLLRQEHDADRVWAVFGNLRLNGQGGHAWCEMQRDGRWYLFETTSPKVRAPIVDSKVHEAVIYFNDVQVLAVPGLQVKEPLSACWCLKFLEDYLDTRQCTGMI